MYNQEIEKIVTLLVESSSPSLFITASMRTKFEVWSGISSDLFCHVLTPIYLQDTLNLKKKATLQTSSIFQIRELELEAFADKTIQYSIGSSIVGDLLLASYQGSICYSSFIKNSTEAVAQLTHAFPSSKFTEVTDHFHQEIAANLLTLDKSNFKIPILLVGTPFQKAVWMALLQIPMGVLTSYANIAQHIGKPATAARAIGTAIGSNHIAYLIPCHRVIRADGHIGEYRWEKVRKQVLIGLELGQSRPNLRV